jgi:hypothetical protein
MVAACPTGSSELLASEYFGRRALVLGFAGRFESAGVGHATPRMADVVLARGGREALGCSGETAPIPAFVVRRDMMSPSAWKASR